MHDEGAAGPQLVAVCVCACMYVQTYATLRLYGWMPHFFSKHANSYNTSTTTEEICILKWLAARLRKGSQFRACALWEDTSCLGLIHDSALQSRPLLAAVGAFKVVPLNHRSQRTRRLLPSRTPRHREDPYDDAGIRQRECQDGSRLAGKVVQWCLLLRACLNRVDAFIS